MLIRTKPAFLWGEGHTLEIDPNHPWADNVLLAIPCNRQVLEDVGPYQALHQPFTNNSADTSLGTLDYMKSCPEGGFMVHNQGKLGSDSLGGIRISSPRSDPIVGSLSYQFYAMCFAGYGVTSARNWRNVFCKGGGGGTEVWTGPYWAGSPAGLFVQYDDGASANELTPTGTTGIPGKVYAVGWGQDGPSNIREACLTIFAKESTATVGSWNTSGTAFACNNTHPWIIGNGRVRTDYLEAGVWNCVVIDKFIRPEEWRDWTREPHQIYRRKVERSFFFLTMSQAYASAYLMRRRRV